jgi:predicted N-formylglutamate amidohydrolase
MTTDDPTPASRRTAHGRRHSIEYIELEIRQDLIDAPARAAAVAERIAAALREIA